MADQRIDVARMGRASGRVVFGKIVGLGFFRAGLVHARNWEGGTSERQRFRDLMAQGAARKRGVPKACPELVQGQAPALGSVRAHGERPSRPLRGALRHEVVGSYSREL